MRIIEEEALKDNTAQVRAILPVDIAAYLLNEKRQAIIDIEKRQNVSLIIVPNADLLTPHYEVERIRQSDFNEDEKLASYKLTIKPETTGVQPTSQPMQKFHQEPAVKSVPADELPAPPTSQNTDARNNKGEPGLIKKLFTFLFDKKEESTATTHHQSSIERPQRSRPLNHNRRKPGGPRHNNNRNRNDRNRRHGNNGYRNNDNRDPNRVREPRDANVPAQTQAPREHHQPQHQHQQRHERNERHDHAGGRPHEHREEVTSVNTLPMAASTPNANLPQVINPPRQQQPAATSERKPPLASAPTTNDVTHVSHVTPTATGTADQPLQSQTENAERKPRRFKSHRNRYRHGRHHGNKSQQDRGENRHVLEGEDIYSSKSNSDSTSNNSGGDDVA